jgi:short-subunit dehydrogenase involved in D-alanine esterification of teichoic acids
MDTLREVADSNPGMQTPAPDLQVADSIRMAARRVAASFSDLNVLINDGGIQKAENLLDEPFDLTERCGFNYDGAEDQRLVCRIVTRI